MAAVVYLTDPVVAAAYGVAPGEWASVADDDEAQWLLDNFHGYAMDNPRPVPAPYFVHPDAPLPFVAYTPPVAAPTPSPPPAAPAPAPRKIIRRRDETSSGEPRE